MRIAALASCFILTVLNGRRDSVSATGLPEKDAKRSWGQIVADDKTLQFKVTLIPKNRKLDTPRFNNRLSSAWLKADNAKKPLKLVPQETTWDVFLPKEIEAADADVILKLIEPVSISSVKVVQGKDGKVGLPAQLARTHGKLPLFEPQPHKNTIGYRANKQDWAEWSPEIRAPNDLELEAFQGCGKGQAEAQLSLSCLPMAKSPARN